MGSLTNNRSRELIVSGGSSAVSEAHSVVELSTDSGLLLNFWSTFPFTLYTCAWAQGNVQNPRLSYYDARQPTSCTFLPIAPGYLYVEGEHIRAPQLFSCEANRACPWGTTRENRFIKEPVMPTWVKTEPVVVLQTRRALAYIPSCAIPLVITTNQGVPVMKWWG